MFEFCCVVVCLCLCSFFGRSHPAARARVVPAHGRGGAGRRHILGRPSAHRRRARRPSAGSTANGAAARLPYTIHQYTIQSTKLFSRQALDALFPLVPEPSAAAVADCAHCPSCRYVWRLLVVVRREMCGAFVKYEPWLCFLAITAVDTATPSRHTAAASAWPRPRSTSGTSTSSAPPVSRVSSHPHFAGGGHGRVNLAVIILKEFFRGNGIFSYLFVVDTQLDAIVQLLSVLARAGGARAEVQVCCVFVCVDV